LSHFLFGNRLVSLPFCDYGGILAENKEVAGSLIFASVEMAKKLSNAILEMRSLRALDSRYLVTSTPRVRMAMELNGNWEVLWKSFNPKLRSQIRKPEKEGLVPKFAHLELLEDFYKVFSYNMRDLGSPVHSKAFIKAVLEQYGESSMLQVVYRGQTPVGAGLIICFKDTVYIPWASTLRKFNHLSPNMMLYWNFLKYAADCGFRRFDFGRSTPGEGTYKFKEQWGAKPTPLYWQYWRKDSSHQSFDGVNDIDKYRSLVSLWKRLPVPLANLIGPSIRKHISL
jgi:FemAB-related protein (PEP-CTERM system-associated)